MLRGTIAAVVTPLRGGGSTVDADAVPAYVDFLRDGGLDGVLALGTNGEGILLTVEERREVTEAFLEAAAGGLLVAAHCGAQTTADTAALAEHAAAAGVDAVAVIGPPYFKLDVEAQYRHLLTAATACAPTPFYVYEFAATAGYAFDPGMLLRLRDEADNVVGLKVSDTPWDAFAGYLLANRAAWFAVTIAMVVAVFALFKVVMGGWDLPLGIEAFLYGVNYSLCFVLIYVTGSILAIRRLRTAAPLKPDRGHRLVHRVRPSAV